jgi:hypothetical protein
MNAEATKLLQSDLGAKTAQQEKAVQGQSANDAFQKYAANPDFARNPALMAAAYNKIQGGAQREGIGDTLAGARQDQGTHEQGLQMQNQIANRAFDVGKYNTGIDQQNNQPGFFQGMLMNTLSQAGGIGLGKLLGPGSSTGGDAGGGDYAGYSGSTGGLAGNMPGFGSAGGGSWGGLKMPGSGGGNILSPLGMGG